MGLFKVVRGRTFEPRCDVQIEGCHLVHHGPVSLLLVNFSVRNPGFVRVAVNNALPADESIEPGETIRSSALVPTPEGNGTPGAYRVRLTISGYRAGPIVGLHLPDEERDEQLLRQSQDAESHVSGGRQRQWSWSTRQLVP